MKRYFHAAIGLFTAIALAGSLTPEALAASSHCPTGGTPAPGSSVNGGLEVDGACSLSNVTVNGGIVVDKNAGLGFVDSTVNGGIVVTSGGELDINHTLSGANQTGTTGTVNGEIVMTNPVDFDLLSARVNGGVQVNGENTGSAPSICGLTINGGVRMSNVASSGVFLGDPEDRPAFANYLCPGNTINGDVTFSHVNRGAIEGNAINGSVTLDASSVEFNGNTITGQSICTTGSTIVPGETPDPTSNVCIHSGATLIEGQGSGSAGSASQPQPLASTPSTMPQAAQGGHASKLRRHSRRHRHAALSRHLRPSRVRF